MRDTTLLGALNAVALAQRQGIWFMKIQRCGGGTAVAIQSVNAGQ